MAGSSPNPRARRVRTPWTVELRRACFLLAASAAFYWFSFAFGGWTIYLDNVGIVYMDLLVAWIAVLLNIFAWPDLWEGLRHLVASHPKESDALVARRAFFTTLGLVALAVLILPVQYHIVSSTDVWLLLLYVSAFPFLAWIFVPILALHGILFGRVANYLDTLSRRVTQAGVVVLFAVAAATTAVVLANPGATVFVRSWSAGWGALPAAACAGYLCIASGITLHSLPEPKPTRGWGAAITPRRAEPPF